MSFRHSRIGVEVDLLVFETAPQSLDKDVVHAAALAIHVDHDLVPLQGAGEIAASDRFRGEGAIRGWADEGRLSTLLSRSRWVLRTTGMGHEEPLAAA